MGHERDRVGMRFARGSRCFAVIVDEAVVGYGWLSTRPEWVGEIHLEIRPGSGEGYVWNCVTLPEHRRKGVFHSLILGISDVTRREGLKRLWIGSVAIPAERALAPAGFRPALHFAALDVAARLELLVAFVWRADSVLGAEGLRVLGEARPGLRVRRLKPRRH